MDAAVILILIAEAALALVLLYLAGVLKKPRHVLVSALLLAAAFALRGFMLRHVTGDYETFLSQWVRYFADNGGFAALKKPVGNYNIPYLYFLAAFSYSDISPLYLIKLLSILFDVLLAFAAMKLAGLYVKNAQRRLVCFFIVLFLPTVMLNGAYWAQCDSIYVSLAVLGLYLALDERPWPAVIMFALSFSFKLQAVFILPVLFVLLVTRHIKFRHFLALPATYCLAVLPAVLSGRPFIETITLYFDQAGTVGSGLNYNSASVFSLITNVQDEGLWSVIGIVAAFAAMLAVIIAVARRPDKVGRLTVLSAAVLMAVAIPFLLPHMHERYFFAADVLTVILAALSPGLFALPCLAQFGSLLGYHAYLKGRYLLPMACAGLSMLAAAVFAAVIFIMSFKGRKRY